MRRWSVIQLPAKPRQVASLEWSQRTPGPASKRAAVTCCQPQPTPEDPGPKTTRAFRDSSVQKTGKEKSSFKVLLCSALATFVAPNWICAVWSWASHLRPPLHPPSPPFHAFRRLLHASLCLPSAGRVEGSCVWIKRNICQFYRFIIKKPLGNKRTKGPSFCTRWLNWVRLATN